MGKKGVFQDFFEKPEEDVETFFESMRPVLRSDREELKDPKFSNVKAIIKGDIIDAGKTPEVGDKAQRVDYIEIQHGWHGDDYIWHIKPWHPKKQYRVALKRILYVCAETMSTTIPRDIKVDVWEPSKAWEIPEISFKAYDLRKQWNINDKAIYKMNMKLFERLNAFT